MGPTAAVLATRFSEEERSWLVEFVRAISDEVSGGDFWVSAERFLGSIPGEARPFIWSHDETMLEQDDADRIASELGFRPSAAIVFGAMCNDPEDHLVLARLCEETARRLQGVIDFLGQLGEPLLSLPSVGKLIEINGRHVGTPDFLHEWSKKPRFRMVK
jgi:hypothetical protein